MSTYAALDVDDDAPGRSIDMTLGPISGEACSVAQRTGARAFAAVARHVGDWRAQRAEAIFAACDPLDSDLRT